MEDIKLVEELINEAKKCNLFEGNKYHEAIEHILLDYKRVLKENESLQKRMMIVIVNINIISNLKVYQFKK